MIDSKPRILYPTLHTTSLLSKFQIRSTKMLITANKLAFRKLLLGVQGEVNAKYNTQRLVSTFTLMLIGITLENLIQYLSVPQIQMYGISAGV